MLAWTATPDRFAFNKSSTLSQQRIRRLAEAEKENWHKRSVHANLQNVTRNLERAKRRLRISRPGVRVPSIAPKTHEESKDSPWVFRFSRCLHIFAHQLHICGIGSIFCASFAQRDLRRTKRKFLGEQKPDKFPAFVWIHLPDGFKDHRTCDICCLRRFVFLRSAGVGT